MQHIACVTIDARAEATAGDGSEGEGSIEQCDIHSTLIERVSHHIFIAETCERSVVCEPGEYGIVLYFAETDHIDRTKGIDGSDDLADVDEFSVHASTAPAVCSFGKELMVVVTIVVKSVECVFAVVCRSTEGLCTTDTGNSQHQCQQQDGQCLSCQSVHLGY